MEFQKNINRILKPEKHAIYRYILHVSKNGGNNKPYSLYSISFDKKNENERECSQWEDIGNLKHIG